MAAQAKGRAVPKSQIPAPKPESCEDDDGLGPEVLMSDELGGGDSFDPVCLPSGKYVLAGGVTIWPLRRSDDGAWEALFPLLTLLSLECAHESRLCRRVTWGPETTDWSVALIDGLPVLVRPADLSVYTDGEAVEV